jgi:hypothetical protein
VRRWVGKWAMTAWLTFSAFVVLLVAVAQAAVK